MSIRNLDKLFSPKRIAIIGASNNPSSVGYTVLSNLIVSGYDGVVYPVNPHRESIQGIQAYARVSDLPKPADLAVICTPAATVPSIVRECGEAGIHGLIVTSAGFAEIGPAGKALQQQLHNEARRYEGMRIIGPNSLGVIVPPIRLNASFAAAMPRQGHVAFISQSGALCTSVLDWAIEQNIGFSYFVSIGNKLDVDFADLIDYFGQSDTVKSILLYVESIKDARRFMSAARAFARSKPIIAYKAGRFEESAHAVLSHTGALAGADDVYSTAFQRVGIERVFEIEDMFDCAELLANRRLPKGRRLAIITNAGGPGVMATDALLSLNGTLAKLSDDTLQKLNATLPTCWSHGNPVDILGDAPAERFGAAMQVVLADEAVDAILVILTPQAMTHPLEAARAVIQASAGNSKPVLAAWMGGPAVRPAVGLLNEAAVPTYDTPERAIHAFMHMVSYALNLEVLYETPREVPVFLDSDTQNRRQACQAILNCGQSLLSEAQAKSLLRAYDIPVTETFEAYSTQQAVALAQQVGYPVVLKILSPQITHKTDAGGVALNLHDDDEVRSAFHRITTNAKRHDPQASVAGVTVQKMITAENSLEMILGAKKDPTFGTVILLGTGGVTAELFRDVVLGLPPLNERLARRLLESLRSWPLLQGYRGRPVSDTGQLIEVLIRFSYLLADHPQIQELDINPLIVAPDTIVAVDARVVVDQATPVASERPYSHLAIRPYPEQYIRHVRLKDGTPVVLRPIKPEDEPMWHQLLEACSPETIRCRFFSLIKQFTHEMAARYCCIDYDREMAIVGELDQDGLRKVVGVGRMIADPNHESAEYAVLVADPRQGKGLGFMLTDFCMEIAKSWGIRRVSASTLLNNSRMLAAFKKAGFELKEDFQEGVILANKLI